MLETLRKFGIDASNSRPRVSNDNPYSESLFKTLKYKPDFKTKGFASIEEARIWTKDFVDWYNNEHRHSGINFVSPGKRHDGKDKEILEKRKEVYETAKQAHPERWSKEIRDWSPVGNVYLNPEKEIKIIEKPIDAKVS